MESGQASEQVNPSFYKFQRVGDGAGKLGWRFPQSTGVIFQLSKIYVGALNR